ncbi:hypothetical protein H2200_010723 [Cladophialophora chaetospira]|uniref:Uncharacterized protein n=1 Tax=Cladophialophora chaetospira TaxID=386627 RepID=A0AA39CDU7_9EURO|nr:hypothetical protein H2200_010723 [Cladophialophora chaetospira]
MAASKLDLLQSVLEAAGGLERFNQVEWIQVVNDVDGLFWAIKGYPGRQTVSAYVDTKQPRVIFYNLGGRLDDPHLRWIWTPKYLSIERPDGSVVLSREDPFKHFEGHTLHTPWDDLDLLYFRGYAMWNYLMTPFYFTWPGIRTKEVEEHTENGQTWRVLEVTYPDDFATHCRVQRFYYDERYQLRRLDYASEVIQGSPVAHYVYDEKKVDGIMFPMLRRALNMKNGVGVGRSMVLINFHKISLKGPQVRSNL